MLQHFVVLAQKFQSQKSHIRILFNFVKFLMADFNKAAFSTLQKSLTHGLSFTLFETAMGFKQACL